MIFVTVGTHEQPFNRLVQYMDKLKESGVIADEIVIQTGFSTYEPKHCVWHRLISRKELSQYMQEARIVITHGGPASFLAPLEQGKIPIVVPRKKQYGEHVNDHQVDFAWAVARRYGSIIVVDEPQEIADLIQNYDKVVSGMTASRESNSANFCEAMKKIAQELVGEQTGG